MVMKLLQQSHCSHSHTKRNSLEYNLRHSRLCFKTCQGDPNETVINEAKYLLLAGVYIFKAPEGDDEWNYKWKKDIEAES